MSLVEQLHPSVSTKKSAGMASGEHESSWSTAQIPLQDIPSPCYVCDESELEKNAKVFDVVRQKAGCKIILALKAFSMYSVFPVIRPYLDGTTASSLNEARLGAEEFGKEVHVYSPAYLDSEFEDILKIADHISFNSFSQWQKFRGRVKASPRKIHCAIRINPEHSEVQKPLYDPCAKYSRMGVTLAEFRPDLLERS